MRAMGRFANAWKALFDGKTPQAAGGLLSGVLQTGQAPRRGTRELMIAYKRLPWVHSVVHRIAHDTAAVPLCLYRPAKKSQTRALERRLLGARGTIRKAMVDNAKRAGELEEVEQHPFLDLSRSMNPALGGMMSRAVTQAFLDLKGETFWVKERNGLGQTIEAWPVPPHWIIDVPSGSSPFFRASYSGWQKLFAESDVLWFKDADLENPYGRGVGLGESLADELDIDELSSKYIKDWFFNNAVPPVIFSLKDAGEKELTRFEASLLQKHQGVGKGHRPYFTNSDLKVEQLGMTFKEQELSQLRTIQRDTIIQAFNIPPEVMGIIENSNRATIDAADYLYARGVLCPRLDFQVDVMQRLVDEYGEEGLVLDYVSPVPDDREFKQKVMVALPSNYTVDEHRALAGLPPLPNGEGEALYAPAPMGILGPGETPPGGDPPPDDPADEPDQGADEEQEGEGEDPGDAAKAQWKSTRTKTLTPHELEQVLDELRPERLTDQLDPVWRERTRKWGQRVLDELGIDSTFDMRNPLIADHLESFATLKIKGLVNESTRDELRYQLRQGVYAGEGIQDLQKRVADVFDFADKVRARRIARTEVVGSSNFANLEAFDQSGVVPSKEWLAVRDSNTRDAHRELDGQIVGVRDAFATTGGSAQYPGGFGVAELDINCRCSVLPVVEDVKGVGGLFLNKALTEEEKVAVWKRYDKRLSPWENQAAAALRRGFRKQEHDVLSQLDRLA